MTTTEGNKLIAEFMGGKVSYFSVTNFPHYKGLTHGRNILFEDLKYHSSWDWLKPVVDEIFLYALAHPDQVEPIRKMSIVVEIGVCWEKCVQFIQWYNNQNQQP